MFDVIFQTVTVLILFNFSAIFGYILVSMMYPTNLSDSDADFIFFYAKQVFEADLITGQFLDVEIPTSYEPEVIDHYESWSKSISMETI